MAKAEEKSKIADNQPVTDRACAAGLRRLETLVGRLGLKEAEAARHYDEAKRNFDLADEALKAAWGEDFNRLIQHIQADSTFNYQGFGVFMRGLDASIK